MKNKTISDLKGDIEYQEIKQEWVKDKPNFSFFEVFEKMMATKAKRKHMEAKYGIKVPEINFEELLKAANGEIIDEDEEYNILNKIQYRKSRGVYSFEQELPETN
jgi:hypothetical protein